MQNVITVKMNKVSTDPNNQVRAVMHYTDHVDSIQASIENAADPAKVIASIPPIEVEPVMGTDTYKIINGHHRYQAYHNLGLKTILVKVMSNLSEVDKVFLGHDSNCEPKPKLVGGTEGINAALTKLHGLGQDILDVDLQERLRVSNNHKHRSTVSRIANAILLGKGVRPVRVWQDTQLQAQSKLHSSKSTVAKYSTGEKWAQGMGNLMSEMANTGKEYGILLIYFQTGAKKAGWSDSEKSLNNTLEFFDLPITVLYLN